MELLAEIIRSITVIIILSLCLELLLPKSELQPYIKTVTGLLLIIAVLYPLKNAEAQSGFDAILRRSDYKTEQIIEAGAELYADWEQEAEADYLKSINSQIISILSLDKDIIDISVDCYYSNEKLCADMQITAAIMNESKSEKWLQSLNAYFGISPENVKIKLLPPSEKGVQND